MLRNKRIILIRHGESEGNVDKDVYITTPDYRVPLTEKGKQQARDVGPKLAKLLDRVEVSVLYSPYHRAKETYKLAIEGRPYLEGYEEPLIREQEYVQDAYSRDHVEAEVVRMKAKDRFWHRFTGGESYADVDQRVVNLMLMVNQTVQNNDLVLFTHGNYIESFVKRVLGFSVEEFTKFGNVDNCNIVVLEQNWITGEVTLNEELSTPSEFITSIVNLRRKE